MRTINNKSFFLIMILFSLSGCKSVNNKMIKEADILYVKLGIVNNNDRFVYVDKFGELVFPRDPANNFIKAYPFSCGLGLVLDHNNKWKYINNKGEVVIDASEYSLCWNFEENIGSYARGFKGLAYVYKGFVTDPWPNYLYYEEITKEKESNEGKYGLINLKGEIVLPVEYDAIIALPYLHKEGFTHIWLVRKNGLYGALNKKFKLTIPIKYNTMSPFVYGNSMVKLNGYWGLINKKEKVIFPFTITEIGRTSLFDIVPKFLVKQDKKWGIINQKGKTIIPFDYTHWDAYPDYNTIRLYKENGSFMTWVINEDKFVE